MSWYQSRREYGNPFKPLNPSWTPLLHSYYRYLISSSHRKHPHDLHQAVISGVPWGRFKQVQIISFKLWWKGEENNTDIDNSRTTVSVLFQSRTFRAVIRIWNSYRQFLSVPVAKSCPPKDPMHPCWAVQDIPKDPQTIHLAVEFPTVIRTRSTNNSSDRLHEHSSHVLTSVMGRTYESQIGLDVRAFVVMRGEEKTHHFPSHFSHVRPIAIG